MEFFLEIYTEEMPVSHVKAALSQLEEKLKTELSAEQIDIHNLKTFGTCRRLVVYAEIAPSQKDKEKIALGPPKAVAFTPDGEPTAAAKGFAKTQGIELNALQIIKTEKGEYVGIQRAEKGKPSTEILKKVLPETILSLSFPKMMRWGSYSLRFSRPIKNILCLSDGKPLSFSLASLTANDRTYGHKIHSPLKLKVRSFKEYREALRDNKVILEQEERQRMILDEVEKKLSPLGAHLHPAPDLLEKLVYSVEHPYVFLGSFPESHLSLPLEVLSTVMKDGQGIFSVVKGKKQLPLFVGVADAVSDPNSLIQKGNERVLKARLEDAKFFWEQDLKISLKERACSLNQIVFQEKLGTYEDKAQRLKKIVAYFCDKIGAEKIKKDCIQAAELCKADLLTEMVREFPSLQGRIGGLYAKKEGYNEVVSSALYEHYQPVSLEDGSPSSLSGAILSLADKLDSVIGVIGVGVEVSGSSDPFGLRRNANGVCKVIIDKKFSFSFSRLLEKVLSLYGEKFERSIEEIRNFCLDFFAARLHSIYEKMGFRYDLVNAALGAGIDNIYFSYLRLKALDGLKGSAQFEPLVLMAKRVNNILRDQPLCRLNPHLFFEKEERELFTTFSIIKDNVMRMVAKGDFSQAQKMIFRIQSSLNSFFDHVLVMAEDKKLRQNRLALLQTIRKLFSEVADYTQVVLEGEK